MASDWNLFDLNRFGDPALQSFYNQFLEYAVSASAALQGQNSGASENIVEALYCSERKFNARASSSGGKCLVLLNAAVPCLTHFCFNNLLQLPFVLSWVGQASLETKYAVFKKGIPLALEIDGTLVDALKLLPSVSRPRDDARALAASALTELACTFCTFHEVAHLAAGHAAYAQNHFAGEAVSEFYGLFQSRRRKERTLRRVWEFEADKLATVMLMNYLLGSAPSKRHFREAFQLSSDESVLHRQLLGQALLAVSIVFRYLAQPLRKIDGTSFHPHPVVRSVCVHGVMRMAAKHQFNLDIDGLDAEFDSAVTQVDRAFVEWETPREKSKFDDSRRWDSVEQQILELEDDHQRLHPTYQTWAWIPASYWKGLTLD